MGFPLYIAKRYLRSKSSQSAVNIINLVTFLVIVIGSAALFIVLSGFAGLKTFSLSFTNTFDPDLKAVPAQGKFLTLTEATEKQLQEVEGLAAYSREMEERVYLTHRQRSHVAYIKGVDDAFVTTTPVDSILYLGSWDVDGRQAVTGLGIANLLGLTINNYQFPLVALAPKPGKGSLSSGLGRSKPYTEIPLVIKGVYALEENLDKKYVFTDLQLVQALLEKDTDQFSAVNFKLHPEADLEKTQQELEEILGEQVLVKDREALNTTLYRMLNTENLATYLIFTLVLIIALFNVVGAIIMMILDKQQNTRTLYNLGATVKELRKIYFIQGIMVTGLGGLIGVLLGALLIGSQLAFGWLRITPSLAYPVEFEMQNVIIVLATIFILGIIASRIASSRVNERLLSL